MSYVILSVVTATAVGIIAFFLIKGFVDRKAEEELRIAAETIERQVRPFFYTQRTAEMRNLIETFGLINNLRIRVLDIQEELLSDTHREGAEPALDPQMRETFQRDTLQRNTLRFEVPRDDDRRAIRVQPAPEGRLYTLPVREEDGILGYIELRNPPGLVDTTLDKSRAFFVFAGAIAAALAMLIGLIMGKQLTSPILALTNTVGKMREGDLAIRAKIERNDEIGELAGQFNHLAERLQKNFTDLENERDSLKTFAENASHELRTPVTALQTFNELLLGRSGNDPDTRREFLLDSKKQLDRLQSTVQGLLNLTRIDGDLVEIDLEEVTIRELVDETIRCHTQPIAELELRVEQDALPEGARLMCDRIRFVSALSNIVENAIKHSPRNGRIAFACSRDEKATRISITDEGPGIAQSDLPHIFDRFYRARTSPYDGSGLGLALADSIIRLHGGTIEVDSAPGAGCTFTIILPASAP